LSLTIGGLAAVGSESFSIVWNNA